MDGLNESPPGATAAPGTPGPVSGTSDEVATAVEGNLTVARSSNDVRECRRIDGIGCSCRSAMSG